jgi:FlaG/FlaF family flagellin (archaellin)
MKKRETILKSKRAFSAVIASLILMLLAVAAGVVVYAYVMGWIGGATQNPQRQGQLQFDSIYADASASRIRIYVRNVGGVDLNVSKIYVNGVEKANGTALPSAGVAFAVQTVKYLEITYTMTKSYFYEVEVVCKDGTFVSQSVQAK